MLSLCFLSASAATRPAPLQSATAACVTNHFHLCMFFALMLPTRLQDVAGHAKACRRFWSPAPGPPKQRCAEPPDPQDNVAPTVTAVLSAGPWMPSKALTAWTPSSSTATALSSSAWRTHRRPRSGPSPACPPRRPALTRGRRRPGGPPPSPQVAATRIFRIFKPAANPYIGKFL